jgi:hypothetical protein
VALDELANGIRNEVIPLAEAHHIAVVLGQQP